MIESLTFTKSHERVILGLQFGRWGPSSRLCQGSVKVSNRFEILEEYQQANSELDHLKGLAVQQQDRSRVVTIYPHLRERVTHLSKKCEQLDMLLEAINASED